MSAGRYKWLIVGEGEFDFTTYTDLLTRFDVSVSDFLVRCVGGKGNVFRMNKWQERPRTASKSESKIASQFILKNDQGRSDFMGVIFVVDSDDKANLSQNYKDYSEECRSPLVSYAAWQQPRQVSDSIIQLDAMKGVDRELPIYGLCVPFTGEGCLETDLLSAYGFPVKVKDYDCFAATIKAASKSWCSAEPIEGEEWWHLGKNGKARMDKFMYVALNSGFEVNRLKTKLMQEPQIITNIKSAMSLNLSTSFILKSD